MTNCLKRLQCWAENPSPFVPWLKNESPRQNIIHAAKMEVWFTWGLQDIPLTLCTQVKLNTQVPFNTTPTKGARTYFGWVTLSESLWHRQNWDILRLTRNDNFVLWIHRGFWQCDSAQARRPHEQPCFGQFEWFPLAGIHPSGQSKLDHSNPLDLVMLFNLDFT